MVHIQAEAPSTRRARPSNWPLAAATCATRARSSPTAGPAPHDLQPPRRDRLLRPDLRHAALDRRRRHAHAHLVDPRPAEGLQAHRRRQRASASRPSSTRSPPPSSTLGGGSQAALIQALLGPLLVHGNGVTEVGRAAPTPSPSPRSTGASPTRSSRSPPHRGWTITEDDAERESAPTPPHLAWWSPLGPLGISPLQQLGVTLKVEDAAQRYQSALFANGARPPSAIRPARGVPRRSRPSSATRCSPAPRRRRRPLRRPRERRAPGAPAAGPGLEAGRPHRRRGRAHRPAQGRPRGDLRRLPDPAADARHPRPRDVLEHRDPARNGLHRLPRPAARPDRAAPQRRTSSAACCARPTSSSSSTSPASCAAIASRKSRRCARRSTAA
jgi:hypothetical protein